MPLDGIAPELNFPFTSKEIFSPNGVGAKVSANLADEKIGIVIKREKGIQPKVGILVANPKAKETQQIIAIICQFNKSITQDVIDLTHKLCWNFCRSPLLIVIEPTLVRVFSCYEKPERQENNSTQLPFEESETEFSAPKPIYKYNPNAENLSAEAKRAIKALQWIELVSGNFFNKEKKHFPREQKADKTLLDNLSSIRKQLKAKGLEYDTIHDLLARIIFIQFLFDRKDSNGKSVISSEYLEGLYTNKELSFQYHNPEEILRNYDDAYKFFKLLNVRFNGDLFPGDKEEDWQDEMSKVKPEHLSLLADFIGGKFLLENGQSSFWKMYSFDTIPLEFVSSIYEEFVSQQQRQEKSDNEKKTDTKREKGVYYTKSHLVDFVLDNVLPWDEKVWDLKILDPSCGSGIFLVKAFQRLVHRWQNSLSQKEKKSPNFSKQKKEKVIELLENNLFGVDVDKHAVRVASFSLYLALCDELDPRTLWQEVKFPNLREKQIVKRDFFNDDDNNPLFKQFPDIKYDLIIGNAPWERDTIKTSDYVKTWAKDKGWEISYGNIGPLFLPKAASLAESNAYISLVLPALPILTGQSGNAEKFRRRLFEEFKIEEIVNLSDLKDYLFEKAKYPACIVTMKPILPNGQPIQYVCPKQRGGTDEDWRKITIEPMDVNFVQPKEAINEPLIWTVLMCGNRRDFSLVKRLQSQNTVAKMEKEKKALTRQGIIIGDRKNVLYSKRILKTSIFPENTFLELEVSKLPIVEEIKYHSKDSTDFASFNHPHTFIKHSWQRERKRFVASFVKSQEIVLCTRDYLNLHVKEESLLKSATLTYNSRFATYYMRMTDGRLAFDRPNPLVDAFWHVPIPSILEKKFDELESAGKKDRENTLLKIDKIVLDSLNLSESEKILVNDFFDYTLSDFIAKAHSEGRKKTTRESETFLVTKLK